MKPHLLLLPGMLCDEAQWAHQISHLDTNITVGDLSGGDTLTDVANHVLADTTLPSRFALAGLSYGGIVAMEIMRIVPHRVEKLALLDTNPHVGTETKQAAWYHLLDMTTTGAFDRVMPDVLLPNLIHPDHLDDRALVTEITAMALRESPEVYANQLRSLLNREDHMRVLECVTCPTLILCGREDQPCPVRLHEEMAALMPCATLTVVEDSGHLTTMEQPQAVTQALRRWLFTSQM